MEFYQQYKTYYIRYLIHCFILQRPKHISVDRSYTHLSQAGIEPATSRAGGPPSTAAPQRSSA